ncbi:MAG TPA: aryl-sulfate sulfotransferase [Candidatus Dormibacteraeota bacterium]|nr:aryl-sulfate sulfotransferase [Candidatus Dormibacteraeota bacterium]
MSLKVLLFAVAVLAACRAIVNAQVPTNFTGVTTTVYDSNALASGYVFVASCGKQGDKGPFFLQMMNNDGTPHAFQKVGNVALGDDYYPYDFKVLANGLLLNAQYTGWFNYIDGGTVNDQILDENFNVLETISMGNGYQSESHDFELLPNGHVLTMGYYTTVADIRSVRPTAYPRAEISGAIIQELDANRAVVWQWRSWDHFNWNEFADWGLKSSDSLIAGWPVNAVRLDPIDANLLVATTGEAMKINRENGDVMWRLGGAHNQFTFVGVAPQEAIRQLAGHDFHRLPNGNYILFNNGTADGSRTSQVHEYQLDEVTKVATHIWHYIPSNSVATWTRGNAQRLPNGNTFIGWGSSTNGQNPDCTEVTSNGIKVFELSFTNALTDSYRAFRFPYPPSEQTVEATRRELVDGNTYVFTNTGVTIDVGTLDGQAYNSVTVSRQPYAPLFPLFPGKAPLLLPVRVALSQTDIQSISGVISFVPASFAIADADNTTVYYRTTEGQGLFVPLPSQFNPLTGLVSAELSDTGFGEYALGGPDIAEIAFPPLLVEPESLQSTGVITRVPPLVQTGKTYTVNQQLPIALSWCPKGFAGGYALQISINPSFATLQVDMPYVADARYTFSGARSNTTYYWRVNTFNDGGLSDWATNAFSTVPPAIHVTAPNGGEHWRRGLPYFVQWDANIIGNVNLSLYKAGTLLKTIATNIPSPVSYQWSIGLDLVPGSDYSLRISSATNSALFDISDLPFNLVDAPVINQVILLPNGRLQFSVTAPGATTASVLTSTNLSSWQVLQTLTITNDSALFTDSSPATLARRFYRLAVP